MDRSAQDSWVELVAGVLRPARADLARCVRARDEHLVARHAVAEERLHAIAACERRIEAARVSVFAAGDGVVTALMTDLEREWRRLSRRDPDAELMNLWAQIAPPSWIDRKRWRDAAAASRVDAAVLLAADTLGVEAAESAVRSWLSALAASGESSVSIEPAIRWRLTQQAAPFCVRLLAEPLRAAQAVLTGHDGAAVVEARAHDLERAVTAAALARFPERPHLVADLGHAAFVDYVWRASASAEVANPVTALRALWKTGYVLSAVDASGVTLEVAPE